MNDPILRAIDLAIQLHNGQVDKAGEPYIRHPIGVLDILRTNEPRCSVHAQCAAVLHDTIEDTGATVEDLEAHRVDRRVIDLVVALTRGDREPYPEYIRRVRDHSPEARAIKLADVEHNSDFLRVVRVMTVCGPEVASRLTKKYLEAKQILWGTKP